MEYALFHSKFVLITLIKNVLTVRHDFYKGYMYNEERLLQADCVGPTDENITDVTRSQTLVENSQTTVFAGETYWLACETYGAFPGVNLTWIMPPTRDMAHTWRQTVTESSVTSRDSGCNRTIYRRDMNVTVNKEYNNLDVRCLAVNKEFDTCKKEGVITLLVIFGPAFVNLTDQDNKTVTSIFPVVRGRKYSLECTADIAESVVDIDWIFNTKTALKTTPITKRNSDVFYHGFYHSRKLKFTALEELHLQRLVCNATNVNRTSLHVETNVILCIVYGPTQVNVKNNKGDLVSETYTVIENRSISLTCKTDEVKEKANIVWINQREGKPINPTAAIKEIARFKDKIFYREDTFRLSSAHHDQLFSWLASNVHVSELRKSVLIRWNVLRGIKITPITEMEKTAGLSSLEETRDEKLLRQGEEMKRLPSHPLHPKFQALAKNRIKRQS